MMCVRGIMRRACRPAALVILAAGAVFAQTKPALPVYEAASVKVDNSGKLGSSSNGSRGQIVFTNVTLKRLVERAYSVKPFQVTGPGWMDDVRFDISAKYPPDTKSDDRFLMLRALLEERFKLAVHTQSQDLPGYVLEVSKGGLKIKPAEAGDSDTSNNSKDGLHTLTVKKVSMAQVADVMARFLGEMVVDRTTLPGVYDFEVKWANDDRKPEAGETEAPASLFTALQETLGLRLRAAKVPVEVIVVDHAERIPVEN